MSESKTKSMARRKVFVAGGTASALAAAAAVLPLAREVGDGQAAAPKTAPEPGGGYQVTQHVLRYYETARV